MSLLMKKLILSVNDLHDNLLPVPVPVKFDHLFVERHTTKDVDYHLFKRAEIDLGLHKRPPFSYIEPDDPFVINRNTTKNLDQFLFQFPELQACNRF